MFSQRQKVLQTASLFWRISEPTNVMPVSRSLSSHKVELQVKMLGSEVSVSWHQTLKIWVLILYVKKWVAFSYMFPVSSGNLWDSLSFQARLRARREVSEAVRTAIGFWGRNARGIGWNVLKTAQLYMVTKCYHMFQNAEVFFCHLAKESSCLEALQSCLVSKLRITSSSAEPDLSPSGSMCFFLFPIAEGGRTALGLFSAP